MINVQITPKRPIINIDQACTSKQIELEIKSPHSGTEYPIYEGPTTVTPEIDEMQILQTKKKAVMENIFVLPIPVTETHNEYGGLTVVIG